MPLLARGYRWDALTVTQTNRRALCANFTATNGSPSKNLPDSSTAATLKGADWANVSGRGYPVLEITLSATHTGDYTVSIGGRTTGKDFGGSSIHLTTSNTTFDIDILSPTGATDSTNAKDSKWPYNSASSPFSEDAQTFGWHIGNISSLSIGGIPSGESVSVSGVVLKWRTAPTIDVIPAFNNWVPQTTDGAANQLRSDWLVLRADGNKWEAADAYLHSDGVTVTGHTIQGVADMINAGQEIPSDVYTFAKDGIAAVSVTPVPTSGCTGAETDALSCICNNGQAAYMVYGAGAVYYSGAWHYGFDIANGATMPAALLFNGVIDFPPEAGDGMQYDGGAFGGPFEMRSLFFLHGNVFAGTVDKTTRARHSGVPVVVTGGYGSVTTDSEGLGHTGSPEVPNGTTQTVQAQIGAMPYSSVALTFPPRKQMQAWFAADMVTGIVEVDTGVYRIGYWQVWSDTSGKINIGRSWSPNSPIDFSVTIDNNTDCAEPNLAVHPVTGLLSVTYRRGSGSSWNIWRCISADCGATWLYDPAGGGAFKMGLKHIREVIYPTGERLSFYNDQSGGSGTGKILCDVYDNSGTLVGTFPSGGVGGLTSDDSSFGAIFVPQSGRAEVTFVVSNAKRRFVTTDKGRTYLEVT